MKKTLPNTATILLIAIAAILALHIINAAHQGSLLPNCARTYSEGMNAGQLNIPYHVPRKTVYAPLYEVQVSLAASLFGRSWTAMYTATNTLYLVLLIIFLALLGKAAGDRNTGLFAALTVSLYPLMAAAYNRYTMEFPLCALAVMFLYFLHRSDYGRFPVPSLLAGLTLAAGMLTKEPFVAVAAGPLLYTVFLALQDIRRHDRARLSALAIGTISVLCIGIAFFGFRDFLFLFWGRAMHEPSAASWHSFANLRLFTVGLWESQLSLPFFVLLVIGLPAFLTACDRRMAVAVLLSIIGQNAFILFMPHFKTERYLIPQLPLLAFISAFGARALARSKTGAAILTLLALAGIAQVYDLTYGSSLADAQWRGLSYWKAPDMEMAVARKQADTALAVPLARGLLEALRRDPDTQGNDRVFTVSYFPDDWSLEAYAARSYSLLNSHTVLEEVPKVFIASSLARHEHRPVDFLVQIVPSGRDRPALLDPSLNEIMRSYHLWESKYSSAPDFPGPLSRDAFYPLWRDYLRSFEDRGCLCRADGYTVYYYRNVARRSGTEPQGGVPPASHETSSSRRH